ncbi:unnamed protein product [Prorocentrum cordatum]|uniref:Uncharacterized protein n=1 Tax=Prorocentrum cordatum TaxID=2364126 RepID=A0ABN9SHH3_9DINO|nr:unnamed protein product [Polarella glacialis]
MDMYDANPRSHDFRTQDPDEIMTPAFLHHQVTQERGVDKTIPLGLYSDGTPVYKTGSVLAGTMNVTWQRSRHVLWLLLKKQMCKCGCNGRTGDALVCNEVVPHLHALEASGGSMRARLRTWYSKQHRLYPHELQSKLWVRKLRGWMLVDGSAAAARSWACGNRMSAGNEACYRMLGSPDPDTFIENLGGDPAVSMSLDYGVWMAGILDVVEHKMKGRDTESLLPDPSAWINACVEEVRTAPARELPRGASPLQKLTHMEPEGPCKWAELEKIVSAEAAEGPQEEHVRALGAPEGLSGLLCGAAAAWVPGGTPCGDRGLFLQLQARRALSSLLAEVLESASAGVRAQCEADLLACEPGASRLVDLLVRGRPDLETNEVLVELLWRGLHGLRRAGDQAGETPAVNWLRGAIGAESCQKLERVSNQQLNEWVTDIALQLSQRGHSAQGRHEVAPMPECALAWGGLELARCKVTFTARGLLVDSDNAGFEVPWAWVSEPRAAAERGMPLLLRADPAELRKLGVLAEVAAELVVQEAVEMRVASDAADVAEALESVRRLLAADKRPAEGSGSLVAAKRPRQEAQEPPPAEEAQEAQDPPEDEEPAGVAEEPAEQPPLAADKRPAEGSGSLVAAKRPRQEAQEPPPAEEAQEAQEPPEDEEPAGVAEEPAEQPPLAADKRPAEGSGSLVAAKRPRQEAQEPPPAEEAQEAQEPPEDEEPAVVAEEPAEQPPLEEDPAEEAQVEAAAPAEGAAPVAGDGDDEDGGCAREYRQRFDYDIDVARELLQRIPQMLDLRPGPWGPVADFAGRVGIVGLMGAMGAACRLEITGLQGNDDEIWEVENGCGDSGSVSASGYFVQNLAGSFFIALLGQRGWHIRGSPGAPGGVAAVVRTPFFGGPPPWRVDIAGDKAGLVIAVGGGGAAASPAARVRDSLGLGWSSGFCGSLTTFATWMQYTAVLLAGGHTNLAWATLVGMHCTALCAHKMGQLLSSCAATRSEERNRTDERAAARTTRRAAAAKRTAPPATTPPPRRAPRRPRRQEPSPPGTASARRGGAMCLAALLAGARGGGRGAHRREVLHSYRQRRKGHEIAGSWPS